MTGKRRFDRLADVIVDVIAIGLGIYQTKPRLVHLSLAYGMSVSRFLRFEAKFFFALFVSELSELVGGLPEGAVVGGLVAEVKGELLIGFVHREVGIEALLLQRKSALGEPEVLGHFLDEQEFVGVGGLMLSMERGEEAVEIFLPFPSENSEGASEAVAEIVLRRGGFPFVRAWSQECWALARLAMICACVDIIVKFSRNEKRRRGTSASQRFPNREGEAAPVASSIALLYKRIPVRY